MGEGGERGLYLSKSNRIRSVGGIAATLYPIRDLSLFDLEEYGKLRVSGYLTRRIKAGMDYQTPLTPDILWMDPIDVPVPVLHLATSGPGAEISSMQHFMEQFDANGSVPKNFSK